MQQPDFCQATVDAFSPVAGDEHERNLLGNENIRARTAFFGSVVDLAISPNADELYVALAGLQHAVAVLDTATLRTANIIPLPADPTKLLPAIY